MRTMVLLNDLLFLSGCLCQCLAILMMFGGIVYRNKDLKYRSVYAMILLFVVSLMIFKIWSL